MKITVNGEEQILDQPCSVRSLLSQRGLAEVPCAVEINEQLIPRRQHETVALSDGDRVEIVTLVGGG